MRNRRTAGPVSERRLRSRLGATALLAVALAAVACSEPAAAPGLEAPTPRSDAVARLPHAALPDGATVTLDLALTPDELATGLMFRPSLAPDRGMLLLFEAQRHPSIWMKNTLISLDLIFLDNSGIVVHLVPDAPPCAGDPCPTYVTEEPARAVLEMPAGSIAGHGLELGDRLEFTRVPGYPVENEE